MSNVTVTLIEIAESLKTNQEKSTLLFIQVNEWIKGFRKYMKQFVKDTGIHKILELYTADEYLKLFTEKKVKNKAGKAFTLKDSSDEDISTKARLKMDWKSIKENYFDANHMHNNADEYHGIQVENDSDSYHDDMPHGRSKLSPSTDFVAMYAFRAHCLNNFKESPDQHTLHSSQLEREVNMGSEVPPSGRSLNVRISSNPSQHSDESYRTLGVLYDMFTSEKRTFCLSLLMVTNPMYLLQKDYPMKYCCKRLN